MNKFIKKIWSQIFVWVFLLVFYFTVINYFQSTSYSLLAAGFSVFSLYAMFSITVNFLFPRFYKNTKDYFIASALVIISLTMLVIFAEDYVIKPFGEFKSENPPIIFHIIRIFSSLGFTFFVGTSLSLMKQAEQHKEREKLLTEEKLETELKLLKAQINPHFIFNALNNIYSLTYMKAENAPNSVLKLSEMLRYVFYDCSKDKVSLKEEIKYIENYTSFQQMKSEYVQNIKIEMDNSLENLQIAPMLFIPFIENAFKYSRIEETESAFVNISIKKEEELLHFSMENSIPEHAKSSPGSGTGINNVKHRLKIIYPEKHELTIQEQKDKFLVDLILII